MSILDLLWFRLVPLTAWMTIAALVIQALLWILRPASPQTHRIAWGCVLISGMLFARIPINIPDHRLETGAQQELRAIVQPLSESVSDSGARLNDPRTDLRSSQIAPLESARDAKMHPAHFSVRIESEVLPVPVAVLLPFFQRQWSQFGIFVWIVGAVTVLSMGVLNYIRFARHASRCKPASGTWHREWRALLDDRRIRRQIQILLSDSLGPALCILPSGCNVVVPKPLWESLPQTERVAILQHELAHYERNDLFKSLVAQLIAAFHWFNPAAWWARRRFDAAGEWACDDHAACGAGHVAFAKTLMQLAGIRFPSTPLTDAIGRGSLHERIRRLLTAAPIVESRWKKQLVAAISVGIVVVAMVRINRFAEATSPPPHATVASPTVSDKTEGKSESVATRFVRGRVENPQGKPVVGARVWLQRFCAGALRDDRLRREEKTNTDIAWSEWIVVAQTDSRGEFRFGVDPPKLVEAAKRTSFLLQLAATASDLGFGLAQLQGMDAKRDESARVTIRMVDDLPIEGRLVTSDGKPAKGVSVRVLWILQPNAPALDKYIPAIQAGRIYSFRSVEVVPIPGQPKVGVVDPWGRQPNALTDEDGRFTLRGIGAERIARMMVWGPSIDLSTIVVATRPAPESDAQRNAKGVLYLPDLKDDRVLPAAGAFSVSSGGFGRWPHEPKLNHYYARFDHVSAPVRRLLGVVRDRDTGKPVPGVNVSRPGNPSTTNADGRFEMTACSKRDRYQVLLVTTSGRHFNISIPVDDTPGNGPLEFNIDLPKGITARGRVTDRQTDEPVAGIVEYNPLFPNAYLDRLGINRGSTLGAIPRSSSPIAADGTYELQVLPGPGIILVRTKDYYAAWLPWPRHDVYTVPRIDMKRLHEVLAGVSQPIAANTQDVIHIDSGLGAFSMSRAGSIALALIRPEVGKGSLTQNLEAVRGRDIQGIVLDPDGKPISNVMVRGLSLDPVLNVFLKDEHFTANCVSPDESRLLMFRHGDRHLEASEQIPQGFTGRLTVRLKNARP